MTHFGHFARRHFEPLVLSLQVLIDLLVVLVACYVGFALGDWLGLGSPHDPPLSSYFELWVLTAAVCLVCFHGFGMYRPVKSLLNVEEYKGIAKSTLTAFFVLFTLIVFLRSTLPTKSMVGSDTGWLMGTVTQLHSLIDVGPESRINPVNIPRVSAVLAFFLILVLTTVNRFLSFKAIQGLHRRGIGNRNVLIFGTGDTGRWLQRKFLLVPTLGLRLVGFASEDEEEVGSTLERSPVLGGFDDLQALAREHKLSEVFIALPEARGERVMELIEAVERLGMSFRVVPRFYHLMSQRVRIENLDSIPLICRPQRHQNVLRTAAKRCMDIFLAVLVLVLCAPLFALTAILIKRESPGPVMFRQDRVGLDGELFSIFKFRTMFFESCEDAVKPHDAQDSRITRIGRHLRRYSLDELPQFLNVLIGNMSVVGPRPEMPFIVESYGPLERDRLRAKPGITGLWQISYHRQEAIHANLDYDVYYVENQSLLLDIVIMGLTAVAVLKGTGAH